MQDSRQVPGSGKLSLNSVPLASSPGHGILGGSGPVEERKQHQAGKAERQSVAVCVPHSVF